METISCQSLFDKISKILKKNDDIQSFASKKATLEKIDYLLNANIEHESRVFVIRQEIEKLLGALYASCDDHGKSEAKALLAKEAGTKSFLKKKDEKALQLYSECLRYAPESSCLLPIAYANRSAVLFQMGKYQECLTDISRAEASHYPDELMHKLICRRVMCYINLKDKGRAMETLSAASSDCISVPEKTKEKFRREIKMLQEKANLDRRVSTTVKEEGPEIYQGESSKVCFMSSVLEVHCNEKEGRHVVARTDIPETSAVFVERPFAAVLLPPYFHTHCQTCLVPTLNPIPCTGCSDVVFCSEKCCRESAKWHQYECQLLHVLCTVGIAHLALRVVLRAGWNLCCSVRDESSRSVIAGFGDSGVYNGRDDYGRYLSVYHLMTHSENIMPEDSLQYMLAALLLSFTLCDKTSFLADAEKDVPSTEGAGGVDVRDVVAIIYHHICQLVCNAHGITQIIPELRSGSSAVIEDELQKTVASALYATASLMNHSCIPNILNSFRGDLLVIHTTKDIKAGDQIYNCYGPFYARQTRKQRQEALKQQYFFTCTCRACVLPEFLTKEATWEGIKCQDSRCSGTAQWFHRECSHDTEHRMLICTTCQNVVPASEHMISVHSQMQEISSTLESG